MAEIFGDRNDAITSPFSKCTVPDIALIAFHGDAFRRCGKTSRQPLIPHGVRVRHRLHARSGHGVLRENGDIIVIDAGKQRRTTAAVGRAERRLVFVIASSIRTTTPGSHQRTAAGSS
jgi:hypothetical protein